ncbi:MAG: DUF3108 domain-containing protein [Gammaproteobacteria bacterium]|nr:DUF3108 domain-containing protein [Gammaproteobacteria bacterium]
MIIKFLKKVLLPLITTIALNPVTLLAETTTDTAFKPFKANYKVFRKGSELGEAYRQLTTIDGQYLLETDSQISWLFLSDSRHERSTFKLNQNKIVPLAYNYKRTGTGRDRHTKLSFDQNKIVSLYKSKTREFTAQPDILDPQLYQLAMQQQLIAGDKEFEYPIIHRGKEVTYKFKVVATEELSLPYGKINAIKIERIRESSRRKTLLWVAPSLNYTMVKLTQFKEGKEQADLQLAWLKFSED